MACPLPRPTPATIWQRVADAFRANVLGGAPLIPESNEWYVVANDVLAQEAYYSIAEQQWRERDPRYACGDNLVKMAADRGVFPRPARRAQGYVTLTGTAGTSIPSTLGLTLSGNAFAINAAATAPTAIGTNGTAIIPVTAANPGTASNTFTGTGLLQTSLTGIDPVVTPCGTLFTGGSDAETIEQFRTRYLARLAYKPAGNMAWAIEKLMEYPGVTRVCIRNCTCCDEVYRVELYPYFDNTFPYGIPPANVLADIQKWFFGERQGLGLGKVAFGIFGQLYTPITAAVDITIHGLECLSADQVDAVRAQVTAVFSNRCPGELICNRTIDLAIAQIIGTACTFSTNMDPADGVTGLTLTDCGDIQPDCDYQPVMGTLSIPSEVCS